MSKIYFQSPRSSLLIKKLTMEICVEGLYFVVGNKQLTIDNLETFLRNIISKPLQSNKNFTIIITDLQDNILEKFTGGIDTVQAFLDDNFSTENIHDSETSATMSESEPVNKDRPVLNLSANIIIRGGIPPHGATIVTGLGGRKMLVEAILKACGRLVRVTSLGDIQEYNRIMAAREKMQQQSKDQGMGPES